MAGGDVAAKLSPIEATVRSLMAQLKDDLARLVAIPSVSAPDFPEPRQPLLDARRSV